MSADRPQPRCEVADEARRLPLARPGAETRTNDGVILSEGVPAAGRSLSSPGPGSPGSAALSLALLGGVAEPSPRVDDDPDAAVRRVALRSLSSGHKRPDVGAFPAQKQR